MIKTKVKIFSGKNISALENEINEWLITNNDIAINHISQSSYAESPLHSMVIPQNITIISVFYSKDFQEKDNPRLLTETTHPTDMGGVRTSI